jgi:Flp pilus assembly pilin Flp
MEREAMTTTVLKRRNWMRSETGAATAEYAIATLAAVGLAGLLVVILRSDEVRGMLTDIVRNALSIPG